MRLRRICSKPASNWRRSDKESERELHALVAREECIPMHYEDPEDEGRTSPVESKPPELLHECCHSVHGRIKSSNEEIFSLKGEDSRAEERRQP
jgi:hypothetical protein